MFTFPSNTATDIRWYLKRVKVMTLGEIYYRFEEQCSLQLLRLQYFRRQLASDNELGVSTKEFSFCTNTVPQLPELSWDWEGLRSAQTFLLDGQVPVFETEWMESSLDMSWDQAPDTKSHWPRRFFRSIAYRPGNPIGDIRVSWEPARLQHLVALALIARRGERDTRETAISVIETHLSSWMKWNPFLRGIHYISAMECGLRILAVCHAMDLIRGYLSSEALIWQTILCLVRDHASLIAQRTSKFSSRGNHTIAEACGLVYAGLLFPEMPDAEGWYLQGMSLLEEEVSHQVLPDGGGAEQSLWYHAFVVDLYGLTLRLLAYHGHHISKVVHDRYGKALRFLAMFEHTGDRLPHIGDGDGGYALSPYLTLRSRLLASPWHSIPLARTFETTGYTCMIGRVHDEPFSMVFDHGPLGLGPCYGHGHADALAVNLRIGNHDLLIDSGTYMYGGQAEWRQYFRGTGAHNTVTVNGMDQAIQESAFMWSNPYECSVIRCETTPEGNFRVLAKHTGYQERTSVTHWRGILFRQNGQWQIWDYLEGKGCHELTVHWHVGVEPVRSRSCYLIRSASHDMWLRLYGGDVTMHRAESIPIRGWRATHYGVKEPCTTLRSTYYGAVPHEFVTTLSFMKPLEINETECFIFRRWVYEHKAH